jgi:hypothetical protein
MPTLLRAPFSWIGSHKAHYPVTASQFSLTYQAECGSVGIGCMFWNRAVQDADIYVADIGRNHHVVNPATAIYAAMNVCLSCETPISTALP